MTDEMMRLQIEITKKSDEVAQERYNVAQNRYLIGKIDITNLNIALREKDDAKEVQRGMECGIKLAGFNDIKEGDTLEAYKIVEVARTL